MMGIKKMKIEIRNFSIIVYAVMAMIPFCSADNPLIKDIGMSDPHVRVFEDKLYLYSGHDESPKDRLWVMKDWRVFSSTDLINWELETIISPADNYMKNDSINCWASDAATRNGKYYFYFSDHKNGIGVMTSDSPGGPFVDALGKALVAPLHDPTIFIDDDDAARTPFMVYGDKSVGYQIVQLNEDMISLAEAPRTLTIIGEEWEKAPEWMDKNYLFKRGDTYYLSWGRDYAISKNIYGPYQCVGAMGVGHKLNEFAHGSFFEWKGQFYHMWCYYLKSGFKYRECIMTYCHFDADGNVVDDMNFLDQHFATGMGQYEANWAKIEAEWYYEKSPAAEKTPIKTGGFCVSGLKEGRWLRYANMDFGEGVQGFEAQLSASQSGGSIEVRLDHIDGPILGAVDLSTAKHTSGFAPVACAISGAVGKRDVILRFLSDDPLALDAFRFY